MLAPFGESVTVIRQTENAYGDRTPADSHEVCGCSVWPDTSTETITGGMDVVISVLKVLMPVGSDVLSTDRVRVRGTLYDVNGDPFYYRSSISGTRAGIEVELKVSTG